MISAQNGLDHGHSYREARTRSSTSREGWYGKGGAGAGVAACVTGLWVLLTVLLLSTAAGLAHTRRSGRVRATTPDPSLANVLAELGATPGERATLLQFSSAFCAPCRATRRILGEVAGLVPGVAHVEVDAEQHLELVRRLGILKTPTTLVLDSRGHEVKRASGQPRKADVLAALGQAVP
jgi:thiol-disulfide isomerase/thioredoxin